MNNRYWMDASDLYDGDRPLRDTDIMDRLNEQDEEITILRSQRDELLAALIRVMEDCDAAHIEPFGADQAYAAIAKAKGRVTP